MSNASTSSQQDTTSILRNAPFTTGDAPTVDNAPTASDLLLGAYDPTKLHPMAAIEDKLDYLLLEDDKTSDLPGAGTAIPSRGWSDDLCYGTGTMYLSGSSLLLVSHISIYADFDTFPIPPFRFTRLIADAPSLLSFAHHMPMFSNQASPLAGYGGCVKAQGSPWLCPMPDCGSTPS